LIGEEEGGGGRWGWEMLVVTEWCSCSSGGVGLKFYLHIGIYPSHYGVGQIGFLFLVCSWSSRGIPFPEKNNNGFTGASWTLALRRVSK
jgi:hypothetical protein